MVSVFLGMARAWATAAAPDLASLMVSVFLAFSSKRSLVAFSKAASRAASSLPSSEISLPSLLISAVSSSMSAVNSSDCAVFLSRVCLLVPISVSQKALCSASALASSMSFVIISRIIFLALTNGSEPALAAIKDNNLLPVLSACCCKKFATASCSGLRDELRSWTRETFFRLHKHCVFICSSDGTTRHDVDGLLDCFDLTFANDLTLFIVKRLCLALSIEVCQEFLVLCKRCLRVRKITLCCTFCLDGLGLCSRLHSFLHTCSVNLCCEILHCHCIRALGIELSLLQCLLLLGKFLTKLLDEVNDATGRTFIRIGLRIWLVNANAFILGLLQKGLGRIHLVQHGLDLGLVSGLKQSEHGALLEQLGNF